MTGRIKRGVSLYSYQDESFARRMTLEDCVRTSCSFGAYGIELLSEQSFPFYPLRFDPAQYETWHAMLARHGAVAVAEDFFVDYKAVRGQILDRAGQIAVVKAALDHAARLGCRFARALVSIAPEILVACADHAEARGVKLLLEVHAPLHFDHPWILRHAEAFARSGSAYLGFLPDMGMFLDSFPRVWKERFLRLGVKPAIADYIEQAYADRVLSEYVVQRVREMGGDGPALAMAETLRHNAAFAPERMLDHMDRIFNIHGKFYAMTEDLVEPSIPYDRIVAVLKRGGYDGYVCSEYEGNRWIEDAGPVECVEQVRRHQAMLARLIGEDITPSGGA